PRRRRALAALRPARPTARRDPRGSVRPGLRAEPAPRADPRRAGAGRPSAPASSRIPAVHGRAAGPPRPRPGHRPAPAPASVPRRQGLDAVGGPAHLEPSSARTRGLYLRLGFTPWPAIIILPAGPPMYPMWRPAPTSGGETAE